MKDSFFQWEELFIGAALQFPLYFIVGWPVLAIMSVCSVFWRLGGWKSKLFRRLGVPFVVCGSSMFYGVGWTILLAVPFMVWLAPSYGKESWLYKLIKRFCAYSGWLTEDQRADFLVRLICFGWYWLMFSIAYCL